jgi:restriction system protein
MSKYGISNLRKESYIMARRKSKARREDDFFNAIFGLVGFGSFFGTYYLTKSLSTSIGVAIVAFAVVIATLIIRKMNYMDKLRRSGIGDIDKMDGRQFEIYLGELFKKHGYEVRVTQSAGDFGADLVIAKGGKKIVVQAKRYSKNVGIKAVQEAQAAIAHYGASEAWVVSNNDYTDAAKDLAKSNNVKLISRDQLIELILKMNPGVKPVAAPLITSIPTEPSAGIICTKCGNTMVLRKGPKGEFLGCSSFPKCRHVKAVV